MSTTTKRRTKPVDLDLTPAGGEVAVPDAEWSDAVARASAAMRKTFEGRMEVAAASQVARDTPGRTVIDFAREADIPLPTVKEYRQVWAWMLKKSMYVHTIASYSHARLAQSRGSWPSAVEYVAFIGGSTSLAAHRALAERGLVVTPPPPGREWWSHDALRDYLGMAPTRPKPGAKRGTPRTFQEASKLAREFATALLGASPELRDYAVAVVLDRLYEPSRAARDGKMAADKHPNTKSGVTARKCEGLVLKALSTDAEPEAISFIQKARQLIAEHNLVYEMKVGVRR